MIQKIDGATKFVVVNSLGIYSLIKEALRHRYVLPRH